MFSIYQIINMVTEESYVGFTTKPMAVRWSRHKYMVKYGSGGRFHCAVREYGEHLFRVILLEEGWCPKIGKNIREPYWISVLKPEYNATSGGNGSPGHIVTEATRQKLRKPKSSLHRKHISEALMGNVRGLGHKNTEQFKKRQSEKMIGNKYWENRKTRNKSIGAKHE